MQQGLFSGISSDSLRFELGGKGGVLNGIERSHDLHRLDGRLV